MEKFTNQNSNEIVRTKCQIFTRVMGYFRPVSQYNLGKKSEFYSRKYFQEKNISDDTKYENLDLN